MDDLVLILMVEVYGRPLLFLRCKITLIPTKKVLKIVQTSCTKEKSLLHTICKKHCKLSTTCNKCRKTLPNVTNVIEITKKTLSLLSEGLVFLASAIVGVIGRKA